MFVEGVGGGERACKSRSKTLDYLQGDVETFIYLDFVSTLVF